MRGVFDPLRRMRLAVLIAILLLLGMVCHAVHFDHEHPEGIFGGEAEAIHHSQDKKWWLVVLLIYVFSPTLTRSLLNRAEQNAHIFQGTVYEERSKISNPLFFALAKGILHPKIF